MGTALGLTLLVGAVFGILVTRSWQNRELDLMSQVIEDSASAALTFSDPEGAEAALKSAAKLRDINAAFLYTENGFLLAQYRRTGAREVPPPERPGPDRFDRHGIGFTLVRTLQIEGRRTGTLVLVGRMEDLSRLGGIYAICFIAAYGAAFPLVLALSRRLRKAIETPIQELVITARAVTTRHDYSLRVHPRNRDELGQLMEDFNSMLAEIEKQDRELRDYRDRLEELVQERTDQIRLESAEKKSLERQLLRAQRLESLGTLAGGVAHDLNNVLSPIMLSVETLRDLYADPKGQKILALLESATRRGSEIVRQILTFARGTEGEFTAIDLRHPIKETLSIIRQTFPRDIEIRDELAPGHLNLMGDGTQLHQMLLNLCVNARDAMPEGGALTLRVSRRSLEEPYVRLHLDAKIGPYYQVTVEDSGMGMAPETLDRIFEPFFTTKSVGKGTGLGLSTVHAIARSHGGFLTCYSEPGKGTVFNVFLPALEEANSQAEPAPAGALPQGRGELILVVDDESFIREVTCQTLETYGYKVVTAVDGANAMEVYTARGPEIDAVLTDMMMPNMDGRSTIQALRRLDPGVRIIAASGIHAHDQAELPAEVKPDAFLAKPFTTDTLLWTLHRLLAK